MDDILIKNKMLSDTKLIALNQRQQILQLELIKVNEEIDIYRNSICPIKPGMLVKRNNRIYRITQVLTDHDPPILYGQCERRDGLWNEVNSKLHSNYEVFL